eukprot:7864975-Pyramimonas_sp.AAC.1
MSLLRTLWPHFLQMSVASYDKSQTTGGGADRQPDCAEAKPRLPTSAARSASSPSWAPVRPCACPQVI